MSQTPENVEKGLLLPRLRSHLRQMVLSAYDWWKESATYEFNGTGCRHAEREPACRGNGLLDVSIPQCRPKDIVCRVHTFFKKHIDVFQRIGIAIEQKKDASEELKGFAEIIRTAIQQPTSLCDDRRCAKLGDAIIAVDGMDMDHFVANNDKEWELLAEAMSKKLVNPVRQPSSW